MMLINFEKKKTIFLKKFAVLCEFHYMSTKFGIILQYNSHPNGYKGNEAKVNSEKIGNWNEHMYWINSPQAIYLGGINCDIASMRCVICFDSLFY